MIRLAALALVWLVVPVRPAYAQVNDLPFAVGVSLVSIASDEFNTAEAGLSVRFAWTATPLIGAEAELGFFPEDLDVGGTVFTQGRSEGLFGVTIGPAIGRFRPFAKARPGFVHFRRAPQPFACLKIFPPTLPCALEPGDVLFAFDYGGGVELSIARRTFLRLDLSDRLVRYTGPAIDADGELRGDAFFGHDLRFGVGGGLRF